MSRIIPLCNLRINPVRYKLTTHRTLNDSLMVRHDNEVSGFSVHYGIQSLKKAQVFDEKSCVQKPVQL